MTNTLQSSRSAVLVNGCPRPWISCRRGLRQGDPISPYLFILVAHVLQVLIRKSADIRHPVVMHVGCQVLQYANDTLLLVRGELADIQALRRALDQFADATSLQINYTKSTAVPIHMDESTILQCISALGCRTESFPQTYPTQQASAICLCSPNCQMRQVSCRMASSSSKSYGTHDSG